MPVYEYKCKVCDEQFEIEQSFTDDTLTALDGCPVGDDGQHQLKKLFRAVGISFKGDGFYRNDSRSGGGGGTKTSDSSKSTDSAPSSSSDSSSSSAGSSSESSSSTKTSSTKSSDTSTAATS